MASEGLFGAAALLLLSVSTAGFLRRLGLTSPLERLTSGYVVLSALVTVSAYGLARLDRLGDAWAWALVAGLLAGLSRIDLRLQHVAGPDPEPSPPAPEDRFAKMAVSLAVLAAAGAAIVNLVVALTTAPGCWDALTYHLPRVVRYVQNGSFLPYGASYWAEEVHPKGSAAIQAFLVVVASRRDFVMALPQLAAWVATSAAVGGIARVLGLSARSSLVSALAFALTTEGLMQATTSQNDLVAASYLAAALFLLLRHRDGSGPATLVLSIVAIGLGAGTKSTFALAMPSLLIAAVSAAGAARRRPGAAVMGSCLAFSLFVLPSGYLQNWTRFGNPLGPESVRTTHTFEGRPLGDKVRGGALNLFRYSLDFLSPDGLPRTQPFQRIVRCGPCRALRAVGLDPESDFAIRQPFQCVKWGLAHEDSSSWGLIGMLLIWPAVLWSAIRGARGPRRHLAWAALTFLLVNAFAGPYDPWRGRTFLMGAVFAAPLAGLFFDSPLRRTRVLAGIALLAGAASAPIALVLRGSAPLVTFPYAGKMQTSLFRQDRPGQLSRNNPELAPAVRRFEELVPEGAVVGTLLPEDSYLFPFFGPRLTRRLAPLNPWDGPQRNAPPSATFLLFHSDLQSPRPDDLPLAAKLFLRPITH